MQTRTFIQNATYSLLLLFMLMDTPKAAYTVASTVTTAGVFNNTGASISMQTIYQNYTYGTWSISLSESVGELGVGGIVKSGAYIAVGYDISNESGPFYASCSPSGCFGTVNLIAGNPYWFCDYSPIGSPSKIYSEIGLSSLLTINGAFNTYYLKPNGAVWSAYLDGNKICDIQLNTSNSTWDPPTVGVTYSSPAGIYVPMKITQFRNFSIYTTNVFSPVSKGYAAAGYLAGNASPPQNLYGIQEIDNQSNYFGIGSGLNVPSEGALLWNTSPRAASTTSVMISSTATTMSIKTSSVTTTVSASPSNFKASTNDDVIVILTILILVAALAFFISRKRRAKTRSSRY